MQAAEFIAMCAARGIDLSHVGGNASNTDGVAAPRRLTPKEREHRQKEHLPLRVEINARGNGTRVYRRPMYSLSELGIAAGGVRELPWLAAFYSWGGDRDPDTYVTLFWGLSEYGKSLAKRHRWPVGVDRLSRPTLCDAVDARQHAEDIAAQAKASGDAVAQERAYVALGRARERESAARRQPPPYVDELVGLLLEEEGDLRQYFIASQTVHAIYMDVDEATWTKHLASPYASLQQRYQQWLGTARSMIQRKISGEQT